MGKDFVDSNCVIRQENGACYSPDSLTQKWIRFHKANELKPIRLHDLRHTCATAMLGEGVDFKVMQTRLGHSDIRTTMNTYAHTLPSMNKEAGEKLDTMMFGDKKNIG
jgi:integrase